MSSTPGDRLREAVTEAFDCDPVTAELLEMACATLNICEALSDAVAIEGALVAGKTNPTLVELRQQRLLLSRLLALLKLPAELDVPGAA